MPTETHPLLARRHPGWEVADHWRFLIDAYLGGPTWTQRHIFRFYKEGEAEFKDRQARAYRQNLSRRVVKTYTSHLFKVPAVRDRSGAPEAVKAWWTDADKEGRSIEDLMRLVSDWSGAVSPVFVVVDRPGRPQGLQGVPLSVADEQTLGLRPYAYVVMPTQVLDFGLDEDGAFTWIAIEERGRDDADPLTATGAAVTRIRLWTREDWSLYQVDPEAEGGLRLVTPPTPHGLGRVPVVQVSHEDGPDRYRGVALLEEIAYKDRAIANNESRLDAIICDQTFSQLAIPHKGLLASAGRDEDGKRRAMIEMGTRRVFLFNDDAQHPPMYLSPDADQARLVLDLIAQQRREVFEDAVLDSEGGRQRQGAETATGRAYDFEKLNAALVGKARNLERAERQLIELVCLWTGTPIPEREALDSLVVYPDKFDVSALADDLAEAVKLTQVPGLGPTFWAEYLERLVSKVLPDLEEERRAQVLAEITTQVSAHHLGALAGTLTTATAAGLVPQASAVDRMAAAMGQDPATVRQALDAERAARLAEVGIDPLDDLEL
jgi:hypothetical protein